LRMDMEGVGATRSAGSERLRRARGALIEPG
jgi:hypothetical protein